MQNKCIREYFSSQNYFCPSKKKIQKIFPTLKIDEGGTESYDGWDGKSHNKFFNIAFRNNKIIISLTKGVSTNWRTKIVYSTEEFFKVKSHLINFIFCDTRPVSEIHSWNDVDEKQKKYG